MPGLELVGWCSVKVAPQETTRVDLIAELGCQLLVAGYNVIDVRDQMDQAARAQGATHPESGVFPTYVTYSEGDGVYFRAHVVAPNSLRFDHVMHVHRIAIDAMNGEDPQELMHRLKSPQLHQRRALRAVSGFALASGGFSLIMGASGIDFILATVLGLLVALLLRALYRPRQEALAPLLAAFLSSVVACLFSATGLLNLSPLQVVMASVILLRPTSGIVNGAEELAGGEMMSGTSRLVYSSVQLLLLALAVFGGYQLVSVGPHNDVELLSNQVAGVAYFGALLFCIGSAVFTQTPVRVFKWILVVVSLSFAAQQIVDIYFNSVLAVGAAAFVGMVSALMIQRLGVGGGPPALVTFTPAFWVLLPGSLAIGAMMEAFSSETPTLAGATILFTLCAIVMGCLLASLVGSLVPNRQKLVPNQLSI